MTFDELDTKIYKPKKTDIHRDTGHVNIVFLEIIKLASHSHLSFILKYLYQAKKVSGHV